MNNSFHEKVLQLVASVAETDEVRTNLELPLYECQLLDSIKTVELMIGIEEEFGLKISPAEFDEVAAELGRALDFAKVPPREKGEVLAAFAAHKDEVTAGYKAN